MKQQQNLNQKQSVSAKTVISAQVLQMGTDELWDYIELQSLENPVIDLDAIPARTLLRDKLDWLAAKNRGGYSARGAVRDTSDDPETNSYWDLGRADEPDLRAHLLFQLLSSPLDEKERAAARYIAGSLSEDGFFTEAPEAAAARLGLPPTLFFEVLERMQALDPPGICAYDLRHCLLLQLERRGADPLARRIVMAHLELLARNQVQLIAKALKAPAKRVLACCELIRSLDPRPGARFSSAADLSYASPDLIVTRGETGFTARFADHAAPEIVISDYYRALCKQGGGEADDYISEKLRQAQNLQHCIRQRQSTLLAIANQLAALQEDFFHSGPDKLVPLQMSEVARRLDVHESTVSRAVRGKYIQCAWGLYPMSYFFPRGLCFEDGGALTCDRLKARLREIIAAEDKAQPLNDRILADILSDAGLSISRRTVAKYRGALGIPSAAGRKCRAP